VAPSGKTCVSPPTIMLEINELLCHKYLKLFSASGAGQGTIDNRIEQAMDLVKSHLMSAVRSEVEELRDKISRLEESVTVLSRENEMLRANVNPDVLANLTGGGRQTSQLQADPTSQQQQQGGGGQH